MDRSSHLLDMTRGNTVFTVNQLRRRETLSKSVYFVFWILIILDQGDGTTLCTQTSESYSLPVSSLCYKTSASANRVVLDGFLTYQSSTNICSCTLTSSKNTTVRFTALANLQPTNFNCGNNILIQSGGITFIISCYVSGTSPVSPTQAVTLDFVKPPDGYYNSNYCMLIDSDVGDVALTLNCDGDFFPTATSIPTSRLSTKSTTTTPTSTTPTKTATTSTAPTTVPKTTTATTTTKTTVTKTTTLLTTTTTNVMSPVTTISTKRSPLSTTASQIITTKLSTPTILVRPSTSSILSQTIPVIGTGLVLICVIVLVVCFRYRRKYKKASNDRTVVYVNETKINLPYSPDNKYEERSSGIVRESSTHIYDVIL